MSHRFAATACLLLALGATACGGESRTVTMRIDHYLEPCADNEPAFCLRVIESSEPELAPMYIAGLEYEWGYVYDVVVNVTDLEEPAADGRSVDYDLLELVDRTPTDPSTEFDLRLSSAFIERVDNRSFELLGDVPAVCESEEVCHAIADAMVDGAGFTIVMSHPTSPGGPFVAHEVSDSD